MITDGNLYHGFETTYHEVSKARVISQYLNSNVSLMYFIEDCIKKKVPRLLILYRLPQCGKSDGPARDFAYGTLYM